MSNIKSVNFCIPGEGYKFIDFESDALLSDADIILFCPNTTPKNVKFRNHWEEEINHSLSLGKTVFILLVNRYIDNYQFLSNLPVQIISASDVDVYSKSKLFESIFNEFKDNWRVDAYIKATKEINEIIFTTRNGDRILGSLFKVNKGHLILMPNLYYDTDDFIHNDEWTYEAETFGHKLIQQLSNIHKTLNSEIEVSQKPEWIELSEFQLAESIRLINEVEKNIGIIEELQIKNDKLLDILKDKEIIKGLLFETGSQLELAVIYALKILGYAAENYNDGTLELDQVILSPEGERFIGECEGKDNKAIDVTKFRQLLDGLNEDFEREEINEKAFGLLFGNSQRLLNPIDRILDFTDKCKRGAEREKIGLINTVDLFKVVKYILENDDSKLQLECRIAIRNQLGSLIKFPLLEVKN